MDIEGERDLQLLETRFFEALKNGEETAVTDLLDNPVFWNYIKEDKLSLAFMQVILLNNVRMLKVLVSYGIDIQETDDMFLESGAMHAARYGHVEMMLYLLEAGVDVNHQSQNGSTALHVAVENQKFKCLKVLVEQSRVDLNIQDCSGYSPLLWCARLRDWQAMEVLISAGCNIESKDFSKGVNALNICVDSKRAFWRGKNVDASDTVKCIDTLVDAGIDIDKGDNFGNSPLVYAVQSNNIPALKHLLKLNCSIGCLTMNSKVLFYFTREDEAGEDNTIVGTDITLFPLYMAIYKLHLRALRILCEAGAPYFRLAREPRIFKYAERSSTLRQFLDTAVSTPLTLKATSRNVIRKCLGKTVLCQASKLGLPKALQDYVCLGNIDLL